MDLAPGPGKRIPVGARVFAAAPAAWLRARIDRGRGSMVAALGVYRYSSWFLTSAFYLWGRQAAYPFKLGVIIALFLAAQVAHRAYCSGREKPVFLKTLVGVEALGTAFLLLPTGGLESPFVWYAINPILVAAAELPLLWCWGILAGFILVAAFLTGWRDAALGLILADNTHVFLVFFLVTLATQLLARLLKYSQDQALLIERQREELEKSFGLISSLYQLVEVVSTRDKVQEVLDLFTNYGRTLAGADRVVIWLATIAAEGNGLAAEPAVGWDEEYPPGLEAARMWEESQGEPGMMEKAIPLEGEEARVVYVPVRSPNRCHGVLAALYRGEAKKDRHILKFLAELCGVALERCRMEEWSQGLLLTEEQNRIANEIHDGVSQYLFSIACGCHALRWKWEEMKPEAVRSQLDLLGQTAHSAARDLRNAIYHLSPRRQGKEVFVESLKSYLTELGALNGIQVQVEVEGSEEVLSPALRKALYRIIREASANAVRHGACRSLSVRLWMAPARVRLEVKDDGCGYRPEPGEGQGLGVENMRQLAANFDGQLIIEGYPGGGTLVKCLIPKDGEKPFKEGADDEDSGN